MKYAFLNNKGFTLLDAMLSFLIFSFLSLSIPLIIKGLHTIEKESIPPRYYEWNLFSESLRMEVWGGSGFLFSNEGITFESNGKVITYERYQDSIRRRVDGQGHEVVLQGIDSFEFSEVPKGIMVSVVFKEGESVESEFYHYTDIQTEIP
ncbi:ComGF family competence protein [Rossellomorea aquimaris]|uniref:competence type IV pilus minor pilin ComGF n=1 Tax=Rossellomorea aquimaris TaxID=189382 RepID=UPI001CD71E81|nr:competence type IV pilus minor pilin ComGF [Rossellomorea aquimaris]MCA1054807.1 ComGF family competence protein [Rossellomorea aquimaris]